MRTLQQGLNEWSDKNGYKDNLNKQKSKPKPKKPAVKLTESDLRELMGTNMPVFRRGKGGAMRQR